MRVVPPFRCPGCDRVREHAVRCSECEERVPVDALGRLVPMDKPSTNPPGMFLLGVPVAALLGTVLFPFHPLAPLVAGAYLVPMLGLSAAAAHHGLRHRSDAGRRHRRERLSILTTKARPLGELVSRLDDTKATLAVRGRAQLIRAAEGDDPQVVARGQGLLGACGRFLVDDGTGRALVDDDAITVFTGSRFAPRSEGVARDGDEVVVVGPARAPTPDERASLGGYRDAKPLVVFDGSAEQHVLIRVVDARAT